MWKYIKKLEYPINIKNKDLNMAKCLLAQYGGPDSELSAAMQYLNQRYTMPDKRGMALLTDIGTEELGHIEMICTMIYQLTKDASIEELKRAGLDGDFIQHGKSLYPSDVNGIPFNTSYISATGDYRSDLETDMASEQRARTMYEHLMTMTSDPDVLGPLSFLRQREVVHYERFKELLEYYKKTYS